MKQSEETIIERLQSAEFVAMLERWYHGDIAPPNEEIDGLEHLRLLVIDYLGIETLETGEGIT